LRDFFWGLAFSTGRSRSPLRFKTSAIMLGDGARPSASGLLSRSTG
jgi:hypothetical protein